MRSLDLIEPRFRARYEQVCVGNKSKDAEHVFFEGMLLKEGLGALTLRSYRGHDGKC
jgi:salicylate hydroxylase